MIRIYIYIYIYIYRYLGFCINIVISHKVIGYKISSNNLPS